MKIAFISTYQPRECGIATFTDDLIQAMAKNIKAGDQDYSAYVVAMDDRDESYAYPGIVRYTIRESHQKDYLKAADLINQNADVCVLQHEFGIFGGESGVYILPLIHRLKVPLVVTFHTILKSPSFSEKAIIQEIGREAEKVVVMSKMAVTFLKDIYQIPGEKISVIEHGFPEFDFSRHDFFKKKYHLTGKTVLMTFGLLNRGKGIETVIKALPMVVDKHPDLVYIILGKTHPNVLKHSGEEYRNFLIRMVKKNKLGQHVIFLDTFLEEEELCEYLSATDIYITPYPNEAQITSGTLAYAVGAGTAVVSTPYWHAQELLEHGRGVLFPFNDHAGLAKVLNDLLDHPEKIHHIKNQAFQSGKRITWPLQGKKYIDLIQKTVKENQTPKQSREVIIDLDLLPQFNLDYVKRMTDKTGILQHAHYSIPNYHHGYCLDDNARALLVTTMAYHREKNRTALELMSVYLAFVNYMQQDNGTFRNFLGYDKAFLDEVGSEDSFGRTIWALGYLQLNAPNDAFFQLARILFNKSVGLFTQLSTLRGISYTLIGINYYLERFPSDEGMVSIMRNLADFLIDSYEQEKTTDWKWFESVLTYDNGILPTSLFYVYEKTEDEKYLKVATETFHFLDSLCFDNDHITLIGNRYWYHRGGERSRFAQQPIDATAMVLMYESAYMVLKKEEYLQKMFTSFMWFFGENDLWVPLYDYETKGCCDGLEKDGVNRNQGAESTLAYLMAYLHILAAFEKE